MRKTLITLLILAVIAFLFPLSLSLMIRDQANAALNPLFVWGQTIGQTIRSPFVWFAEVNEVRRENVDLKERVSRLSNQVIEFESLKKENETLRNELKLRPEVVGFQRVVARVVSHSAPGERQSLVINQGMLAGIGQGDAVISAGVLVGKISAILPRSATVELINSQESFIQARVTETGDKGLVSGKLSGIYLTDLVTESEIKSGMHVETSGLGGSMPAGILIGEITEEKSAVQEAAISVRLHSLVDFNKLDVVFVSTQVKNNQQ